MFWGGFRSIDFSITGGTPPYNYLWTANPGFVPAGQSGLQDLTGLVAGTYRVIATVDMAVVLMFRI